MDNKLTEPNDSPPPYPHGVYREFLAEREEILRHKWLRSEAKRGDIGFDNALTEWVRSHRREWRRNRCGENSCS